MRVLVISNQRENEVPIRNALANLCEGHSLSFSYSFDEAKDLISNYFVKQQIPLDLILTYSNIVNGHANTFRDWIHFDVKRTYSKHDFNLWRIPLAVIVSDNHNITAFNSYQLSIHDSNVEHLYLYTMGLGAIIREWRKEVLEELDHIGIKFNSGNIDYSYFLSEKRLRNRTTQILSENFKRFPRKLNYYWLDYDRVQTEKSIDHFIIMLKQSMRNPKKGDEKKYHKFFKSNRSFLLRDAYSKFWHEQPLQRNESNYEEPDFLLKPNVSYVTDLSILEIKLPTEEFMTMKKYHKQPRSKLLGHIIQINDYKDFLASEEYQSIINNALGFVPKRLEMNLLIGRDKSRNEYLKDLNKTMQQLGQGSLNLMTFDDLMSYQVKFMDRMNLLDIRH